MIRKKLISIICPVYNEEEAVPLFYKRLMSAIESLRQEYDFELIFTNNASEDRTLEVIKDIRLKDPIVQVITFSRNFGYQASILAGLRNAKGIGIVIIDVDCEDPPEMIPRFLMEWEKGCDIVYGRRDKRPEHIALQLARKVFYRITRLIADYDFILDMAEFSLFSSRVRDIILQNHSTFPFIRSELGFVGFKRLGIPYNREPRISGKTHYNFIKMAQFAIGGILSSSTFPLRLAVYLGIPLVFINLFIALLSLMAGGSIDMQVIFLLDFSYAILVLVFLSTYLARIYKDGIRRPLFIVDWQNSILNQANAGEHEPDEEATEKERR
ncbi:MAG: glycosyltransferase family 2 protein [Deltaproteobacteria bacterium]|nr:glycosyltransferase family 2 protein [Deltaproteobacteria bacterium]